MLGGFNPPPLPPFLSNWVRSYVVFWCLATYIWCETSLCIVNMRIMVALYVTCRGIGCCLAMWTFPGEVPGNILLLTLFMISCAELAITSAAIKFGVTHSFTTSNHSLSWPCFQMCLSRSVVSLNVFAQQKVPQQLLVKYNNLETRQWHETAATILQSHSPPLA